MADGYVDYLRGILGWWSSGAEAPVVPGVGDSAVGVPRWPLSLHLYESMGGALIYTFPSPEGVTITDNEHGFESLTGFQPMRAHQAFWLYDLAPAKWVVLSCGGFSVWEGRLEDRKIQRGGFGFTAFGAKRYYDDVLYTALWSTQSYAGIRPVTLDEVAKCAPERYAMDNNNRIWIALVAGETYDDDDHYGEQVYRMPHNAPASNSSIVEIDFTFDWTLPTDWEARLLSYQEGFIGPTVIYTFTSAGAQSTGTTTVAVSGGLRSFVTLQVRNMTGAPVVYAGETGASYAKVTGLRIKGSQSANIFADEIVRGLIEWVTIFNPINASRALVQSPAVDLFEEVYEDMTPAEVLSYLVGKGDDQVPPRKWEWGVWEDQALYFRPQGTGAQHWYVDADEFTLDSTLESLINTTYAIYQDANGRTKRTADLSDANSISKYGLTRRFSISQRTQQTTNADISSATFLAQNKELAPRASLTLYGLFDAVGARYPLWMARAGDTITIRNLPPTLSTEIDRIRTFRMSRKSYSVDSDILTPTPEYGLPTLSLQIANALTYSGAPASGGGQPGTRPFIQPLQPSFS